MANTNPRNPNASPEPTRQSQQVAGKRPTADSPALRFSQYDKGQPNDPPDSSTGTSRGTKVKRRYNCRSPPELSGADPVIQETNVDPPAILAHQEVTAQPPPIVPTDRQEPTVQQPSIVPNPPKIDEPSPKGTMPTLVPLPASGITPAVGNWFYLEQSNWSPYLTPPQLINASSLGNGQDMSPLDVNLPTATTLE